MYQRLDGMQSLMSYQYTGYIGDPMAERVKFNIKTICIRENIRALSILEEKLLCPAFRCHNLGSMDAPRTALNNLSKKSRTRHALIVCE